MLVAAIAFIVCQSILLSKEPHTDLYRVNHRMSDLEDRISELVIKNEHEVFGRVKHELVEKQTTLEKLVAEDLSKRMLAIYGCNDSEVSRRWQQLELAVKGLESRLKIQESIQTTVEESIQTFTNVQQEIMNMMKEIRYEMPRNCA